MSKEHEHDEAHLVDGSFRSPPLTSRLEQKHTMRTMLVNCGLIGSSLRVPDMKREPSISYWQFYPGMGPILKPRYAVLTRTEWLGIF